MSGRHDAAGQRALTTGAATLAVLCSALGFSTIAIGTVIATRDGTALSTVVLGRFLLGAAVLFPLAGGRRGLALGRDHATRILLWGGTGQALINLLNLSALAYLPAATVVFLFYTFPAWVAVIAALRGTERVGSMRAVALLLSLVGIVVILGAPDAGVISPLGASLSLAGAFVYALYIPLLRQLQVGTTAPVAIFYIALGTAVSMLAYGAMRGELTWQLSPPTLGAIVWLALVPTVVAMQLFLRGLETLGPVRTAIISTAEPFCAALLAAVILDQPVTASTVVGGALIAAAVLLLQRPDAGRMDDRVTTRGGGPAAA
ncbi:MAG: EamA family transporter [Gemmatimonadetes bacterium]|nr:EamA family transporter [Gemmatimonadota bacterium]